MVCTMLPRSDKPDESGGGGGWSCAVDVAGGLNSAWISAWCAPLSATSRDLIMLRTYQRHRPCQNRTSRSTTGGTSTMRVLCCLSVLSTCTVSLSALSSSSCMRSRRNVFPLSSPPSRRPPSHPSVFTPPCIALESCVPPASPHARLCDTSGLPNCGALGGDSFGGLPFRSHSIDFDDAGDCRNDFSGAPRIALDCKLSVAVRSLSTIASAARSKSLPSGSPPSSSPETVDRGGVLGAPLACSGACIALIMSTVAFTFVASFTHTRSWEGREVWTVQLGDPCDARLQASPTSNLVGPDKIIVFYSGIKGTENGLILF